MLLAVTLHIVNTKLTGDMLMIQVIFHKNFQLL